MLHVLKTIKSTLEINSHSEQTIADNIEIGLLTMRMVVGCLMEGQYFTCHIDGEYKIKSIIRFDLT